MKTRKLLIIPLLAFCASALAIDSDLFNKMQKLNRGQQATENLHAQAMSAIDECELDEAEQLLQRMRQQGYSAASTKEVAAAVAAANSSSAANAEIAGDAMVLAMNRKFAEAHQAALKMIRSGCSTTMSYGELMVYISAREAEARPAAATSTATSSSSCQRNVIFTFTGPGFDHSARVIMRGPNSFFHQNRRSDLSIDFYNSNSSGCIAGTYTYSYTNDTRILTWGDPQIETNKGSFTINGQHSFCDVTIGDFGGAYLNCY